MLPFDSNITLIQTARELLREEGNTVAASLLIPENVEVVFREHDNWNGGIDYYEVLVSVPVKKYAEIKRKSSIEELTKSIKETFDEVSIGDDSIQFSGVTIRPLSQYSSNVRPMPIVDASFWVPGYFRVFISHLSSEKERATRLKEYLKKYGISCFVAHEDITVTAAWHDEIVKALQSMDCLIAILSKDFNSSSWCDQEVGFGLGRDVLCIPVKNGIDPYGLLGKYQGLNTKDKTYGYVCDKIFRILSVNEKSREKYQQCLVDLFLNSNSEDSALHRLGLLERIPQLERSILSSIRQHFLESSVLKNDKKALKRVNDLLGKYDFDSIEGTSIPYSVSDDDLPF